MWFNLEKYNNNKKKKIEEEKDLRNFSIPKSQQRKSEGRLVYDHLSYYPYDLQEDINNDNGPRMKKSEYIDPIDLVDNSYLHLCEDLNILNNEHPIEDYESNDPEEIIKNKKAQKELKREEKEKKERILEEQEELYYKNNTENYKPLNTVVRDRAHLDKRNISNLNTNQKELENEKNMKKINRVFTHKVAKSDKRSTSRFKNWKKEREINNQEIRDFFDK